MTAKARAALWLFLVYAFSILCYLPRLLEMGGAAVPKALTGLSVGFILAPAFVTLGFLLPGRRVRAHFLENGGAVSLKDAAACLGAALLGALASLVYSFAAGVNLFSQTYGSVAGFGGSCLYLYATAFAEEFSWRAFFLKALAAKGRKAWALFAGRLRVGFLAYPHVDGPRPACLRAGAAFHLGGSGIAGFGRALPAGYGAFRPLVVPHAF